MIIMSELNRIHGKMKIYALSQFTKFEYSDDDDDDETFLNENSVLTCLNGKFEATKRIFFRKNFS